MSTVDRVKQLAQEAGIDVDADTLCRHEGWLEPMLRFAQLVAEDCAMAAVEHFRMGCTPLGSAVACTIRARYDVED